MKFEDWFIKQHGPRPSDKSIVQLIREANIADTQATTTWLLAVDCRAWDYRFTSAHYAWNLTDKDKEK